jgi:hypothetical protein
MEGIRMKTVGLLVAAGASLAMFGVIAVADAVLPPGPNLDLVARTCSACHDLTMLTDTGGMSRADWEGTLDDMKSFGAGFTDIERKLILEYLVAALPPKK